MTFPVPSVAGVFLSLSDRLKTAVTGGSAAHYLLGRTPTRLRNHLGFHAALAQLVDALLERAVLPYQTTSSLASLTVLPTAELSGSAESGGSRVSAAVDLPSAIATSAKRAKIGTETRFAPLEFWLALLNGCCALSDADATIRRPESAASDEYADVVIYPPLFNPEGCGGSEGAIKRSIEDSGWQSGSVDESDVALVDVKSLVTRRGYANSKSYELLSGLVEDYLMVNMSCFKLFRFRECDYDVIGSLGEESLSDATLAALTPWSPVEPQSSGGGRKTTARPNLDLLHVYQILLGCFWANWARMPLKVSIPHRVVTVTYDCTVSWDGTVSQGSPVTKSSTEYKTNRLEWGRGVSATEDGAWRNEGSYSGQFTFPFDILALAKSQSEIRAAYDALVAQRDQAEAEKEEAEEALASAVAEFEDAFKSGLRSNCDRYYDGWGENLMLTLDGDYYGNRIGEIGINNSSPTDAAIDSAWGLVKGFLESYDKLSGSFIKAWTGVFTVGTVSLPSDVKSAREAFVAAAASLQDAEAALELGVGYDRTLDLRSYAQTSYEMGIGTFVWNGDPPKDRESATEPVTLTITSSMTCPLETGIKVSLNSSGSVTPASPWPAESLLYGGYVKKETVAMGGSAPDTLKGTVAGGEEYTDSRSPSGGQMRRLLVKEESASLTSATPVEAIKKLVEELVKERSRELAELGGSFLWGEDGVLPVFPKGTVGYEDKNEDWLDEIGPFWAWYHPDKSPTVRDFGPQAAESHPDIADYFLPYMITGDEFGNSVLWEYPDAPTLTVGVTKEDSSHSQSGRAPTCGDYLNVSIADRVALLSEWNWKSMPVEYS